MRGDYSPIDENTSSSRRTTTKNRINDTYRPGIKKYSWSFLFEKRESINNTNKK